MKDNIECSRLGQYLFGSYHMQYELSIHIFILLLLYMYKYSYGFSRGSVVKMLLHLIDAKFVQS